jgi:hypothetical protein
MRRMSRLRSLLLALALAVPTGPALAQADLATLLNGLAKDKAPEGRVEVQGWLERNGDATELVVTLIPSGAAKLVADPGITVTPQQSLAAAPMSLVDTTRDYLDQPPVLRLPLPGHAGEPVEAAVDYAYCLADYQCLFGEATVRVAGTARACDPATAVC